MKSSVAITLMLVGTAMILGPLVFSYLYHGGPPIHGDSGIGYSWACFLAGGASMAMALLHHSMFPRYVKIVSLENRPTWECPSHLSSATYNRHLPENIPERQEIDMRLSAVTPLVLSALLLSGCTYSVHPILRDSDLTTDVDLSGTWAMKPQDSDRHDWCRFSMQSVDGGANYRGALDNAKEFAARIGKLGDQRYFEFSIVEHPAKQPSLLSSIPVYAIARFETAGDTLQKLLTDHSDELFSESAITFARKPAGTRGTDATEGETESAEVSGGKAEAIRKLEFLIGTWESVEQNSAPPAAETRTIALQPDGLSLTVTTESVLGKGRPVRITFDLESQQYLLTHTNANGDTRVFNAKLTDDSKLKIPIPESVLFSGLDFIVSVKGGQWTETISQPTKPSETLYQRSFLRQQHDPLKAKP